MRLAHRLRCAALEQLSAPTEPHRRKDATTPITKLKPKEPNHRTAKAKNL